MNRVLAPRVWSQITEAAKQSKAARVAIAYFGSAGDKLLPLRRGSVVVVDASVPCVAAGSTSPSALERLRKQGVEIYSATALHAKVCAFEHAAFVGSANASDNSDRTLIEAVLRVDDTRTIVALRSFVESLAITKLSKVDLRELARLYRPPRARWQPPQPTQNKYSTLLMELTGEQGEGRETQVQPPKAVWKHYFGIAFDQRTLPPLRLVNDADNSETRRRIVKHHHNFTIEIAGAEYPRPALLEVRRLEANHYGYRVHRPGDPRYETLRATVENVPNPMRDAGRLWVII